MLFVGCNHNPATPDDPADDPTNTEQPGTDETKSKYTVTFNSNGGSDVEAQTVESGSNATKPEDPTKEGFVFMGWYSDETLETEFIFSETAITSDITLYAKWVDEASVTYVYLKFNSNGGSAVEDQKIASGASGKEPTKPTKDGYYLEGWYSDEALTKKFNFETKITADVTLYANWKAVVILNIYNYEDKRNDADCTTNATDVTKLETGAYKGLCTTQYSGTGLAFNFKQDGSAISTTDYASFTVKFSYKCESWSASSPSPKFKIFTDGVANLYSDALYFDGANSEGTFTKTMSFTKDATYTLIGFNADSWAGAESDTISITVESITLNEPVPANIVDLSLAVSGYGAEIDYESDVLIIKSPATPAADYKGYSQVRLPFTKGDATKVEVTYKNTDSIRIDFMKAGTDPWGNKILPDSSSNYRDGNADFVTEEFSIPADAAYITFGSNGVMEYEIRVSKIELK